jgi:hypothetical protein
MINGINREKSYAPVRNPYHVGGQRYVLAAKPKSK